MTTQAMPLDAIAETEGGLDDYRIAAASEVAAMLRRLQEANVLLNLVAPHGETYTTTLWTMDAARGVVRWDPLESTCRHASLSIL